MNPIDLDYQPPDDAERKRRAVPISPASVVAGGFLGIFFGPMIWVYLSTWVSKTPNDRGLPPVAVQVLAAVEIVTLAAVVGRHLERIMPDARGIALGLYVSAALVAAGGIALGLFVR